MTISRNNMPKEFARMATHHDIFDVEPRNHHPLTQLLHWSAAFAVALAAVTIVTRAYVGDSSDRKLLLHLHQQAGLVMLGLTLVRLGWRPFSGAGALHARLPTTMRVGATMTHAALYLTLLALAILGWLTSDASGHPLRVLGVGLPALIARNRDLGEELQEWHSDLAWLLLVLVLAHVVAALWHHFGRRDDILHSMTSFLARRSGRAGRRAVAWPATLLVFVALCAIAIPASAVPSFSTQTGESCAACHIGAYGPQLTAYGSRFKLGGYTDTGGDAGRKSIPLDLMFVESFTRTGEAQSAAPAAHFATNDNVAMDELSLQLSGGLTDHIGSYWEWSYNQIERKISTENMDVRYTTPFKLAGLDSIFGISLNNNPTVSDPFNTLPAIKFPYMMSSLAPVPSGSPLLAGVLTKQVIGASAYAFVDKSWYLELGDYRSLSRELLQNIHVDDTAGSITGIAPYWRLAYTHDERRLAYSFGIVGMTAHLYPDRTPGSTDNYRDLGLDASYQFLGNRSNIFTANAAYIHEHQDLTASWLAGSAAQTGHALNSVQLDGSYFFHESYGVTLGWFDNTGTHDGILYAPAADSGSRTGTPNSNGTTLELDWTPFGRDDSWMAPWANVRIGLQYVAYWKFNGAGTNYDGYGRNASANNTLYLVFSTIL
jgi:cytochrome b561